MEVREFVRDVLVDVIKGIKEAQREAGVGGYVAPADVGDHRFPQDAGVYNEARIVSTVVKFDMAVTAETSKQGGGGAKVRITVVGAEIGGKLAAKDTQVSRIQFSVPILMPKNPRKWANENERD
jgi:hypothetical protein